MRAYTTLKTPDQQHHELIHGDIIGRIWTAALQLNDARISEAHAMVSLREGNLQLISLRGSMALNGKVTPQIVLSPGQEIELAPKLILTVEEVWLPEEVYGIEGPNLIRQILPGVCSILLEPSGPRMVSGYREDAALNLWDTGDGWMKRQNHQTPVALTPGPITLPPYTLTILTIPLHAASSPQTRKKSDFEAPLYIQILAETTQIRTQEPPITLAFGGKQAELIQLLSVQPAGWQDISASLWPEEEDPLARRARLDIILSRIQRSMRAKGLRSDLIMTDPQGTMSLHLFPQDVLETRVP